MRVPTLLYVVGLASFARSRAGVWTAVTVLLRLGDSTGPLCAWAVFVTLPLLRSLCVTVYTAVQLTAAPTASPLPHPTTPLTLSSVTVIALVRSMFPLFVTY